MYNIPERKIAEQVITTMRANGIIPRSALNFVMDCKKHRFSTNKDKSYETSAFYQIYPDGCPAWYIQDFRQNDKPLKFIFDLNALDETERRDFHAQQNSPEYQQRQAMKAEEQKRQREKESQEREAAIAAAFNEYDNYHKAIRYGDKHPYFKAKGINNELTMFSCLGGHIFKTKIKKEAGDICDIGELLIPLMNAETGIFQSLQRIPPKPDKDGKFSHKFFYKGAPATGACAELVPFVTRNSWNGVFEDHVDKIFICEGVATGLSFLELTENKYPIFAAMSAGNIINVAQGLRKRYSGIRYKNLKIIIAADHDETGIREAQKTISAGHADGFIKPPIKGMDYNDYANYLKGKK